MCGRYVLGPLGTNASGSGSPLASEKVGLSGDPPLAAHPLAGAQTFDVHQSCCEGLGERRRVASHQVEPARPTASTTLAITQVSAYG
jgi:hypothetical protein